MNVLFNIADGGNCTDIAHRQPFAFICVAHKLMSNGVTTGGTRIAVMSGP